MFLARRNGARPRAARARASRPHAARWPVMEARRAPGRLRAYRPRAVATSAEGERTPLRRAAGSTRS